MQSNSGINASRRLWCNDRFFPLQGDMEQRGSKVSYENKFFDPPTHAACPLHFDPFVRPWSFGPSSQSSQSSQSTVSGEICPEHSLPRGSHHIWRCHQEIAPRGHKAADDVSFYATPPESCYLKARFRLDFQRSRWVLHATCIQSAGWTSGLAISNPMNPTASLHMSPFSNPLSSNS